MIDSIHVRPRLLMQGMWVKFLVRRLKSYLACRQKAKTQNRSNTGKNSIKTLKMIHIKKKKTYFLKNKENIKSSMIQIKSRAYSWLSNSTQPPSTVKSTRHPHPPVPFIFAIQPSGGWDKGTVTSVHRSLLIIQVVRET